MRNNCTWKYERMREDAETLETHVYDEFFKIIRQIPVPHLPLDPLNTEFHQPRRRCPREVFLNAAMSFTRRE